MSLTAPEDPPPDGVKVGFGITMLCFGIGWLKYRGFLT